MSSLARRENLAGKVQMIYMDPPYGIKFGSNFQPEVGKRNVTDKEQDPTRDPETVKGLFDGTPNEVEGDEDSGCGDLTNLQNSEDTILITLIAPAWRGKWSDIGDACGLVGPGAGLVGSDGSDSEPVLFAAFESLDFEFAGGNGGAADHLRQGGVAEPLDFVDPALDTIPLRP